MRQASNSTGEWIWHLLCSVPAGKLIKVRTRRILLSISIRLASNRIRDLVQILLPLLVDTIYQTVPRVLMLFLRAQLHLPPLQSPPHYHTSLNMQVLALVKLHRSLQILHLQLHFWHLLSYLASRHQVVNAMSQKLFLVIIQSILTLVKQVSHLLLLQSQNTQM